VATADKVPFDVAMRGTKARLRAAAGKGPARGRAQRAPETSVAKVESDRSRKNSRVKGSRGELDVAKMFSAWCGEIVRRTPQSGGWSNARFGVTADLVCANPAFPFHCEVKHRESWVLDDLVTGIRRDHDKSVVRWWEQCVQSCPTDHDPRAPGKRRWLKEPLLVFRRNHLPWLVMSRNLPEQRSGETAWGSFTLPLFSAAVRDVHVGLLDDFLKGTPVPAGLANHGRAQ
jgi:hypothetical protein